jgi:SAM-dependent methyltransferase
VGQPAGDDLALYDLTRQRLCAALTGELSAATDFEGTLTAYAYWVCSAVRQRNADWETTLQEYITHALRDAARETEAEQAECSLLRRALRVLARGGALLDIGAGWGRLAPLYREAGMNAVCVEPSGLGVRLMRRGGLRRLAAARGEALPFRTETFNAALIGWVLHHESALLDAQRLVGEAARVLMPGGWLFSIEPLRPGFDMVRWRELLDQPEIGLVVQETQEFYAMPDGQGDLEHYTAICAQKLAADRK